LLLKDDFTILIMGGSLGARTINNSSFKILKEYANKEGYKIIWQTGKKNFDEVTKKILDEYDVLPDNLVLQPYIDKIATTPIKIFFITIYFKVNTIILGLTQYKIFCKYRENKPILQISATLAEICAYMNFVVTLQHLKFASVVNDLGAHYHSLVAH
jgi:hypothetical protein